MSELINMPKYNGPGIYALINVYNLSVYIGSSMNLRKRALQHKASIKNNNHPNKKINEFLKEGTFRFVILEKCNENIPKYELTLKEKLYIYEFAQRREYTICNKEAENLTRLQNNIFWDIRYYSGIEKKMNRAFKEEYGINIWDMTRRRKDRRIG